MRLNAIIPVLCILNWTAVILTIAPTLAHARSHNVALNPCDRAAANAAEVSGVPIDVLLAIARVESGRTVNGALFPWPWTVNQAGSGSFFETVNDATDHVLSAMANGESNIDVGCFQINIRWHGTEFASLDMMFEPTENALYAARFLLRLYDELGTWEGAIGAYHSRQTGAATAYVEKVSAMMATTESILAPSTFADSDPDENRYPLLQGGKPSGNGSLVATAADRPAVPLVW